MKQRRQVLDMGYTSEEFARTLQAAFCQPPSGMTCEQQADGWRLTGQEGLQARVRTRERSTRSIGMLALPRLEVEIAVEADSDDAIERFLLRFQQYFHKGGG